VDTDARADKVWLLNVQRKLYQWSERHGLWRAECVTKDACSVRKGATGDRGLRDLTAPVVYSTQSSLIKKYGIVPANIQPSPHFPLQMPMVSLDYPGCPVGKRYVNSTPIYLWIMFRPLRIEYPHAWYHFLNRGRQDT